MAGTLDETNFSSLKEKHDPGQHSLSEFCDSGNTTIAVVRKPNDTGITSVCDEWRPELGMPEAALDEYWSIRGAYDDNRFVTSTEAANRAFYEADLEQRFDKYVRSTPIAQRSLDEVVQRLNDGENITLVCFEGDGKRCHRHILQSMIESRREADLALTR